MPTVNERSTNTIERSVGFEFNQPISSADLNEMQTILLNNMINFMNGKVEASSAKISIDKFTDNHPGITITGIRYCIADSAGTVYYGAIAPSVRIVFPGTVAVGNAYKIYAFWRIVELTPASTVYKDGIRSNSSQVSISESVTPNNILDDNLGIEVSVRKGLELTFIAVLASSAAPSLTGWNRVLCADVTIKDGNYSSVINADPASALEDHINAELPHRFKSGNKTYKYGLSINETTNNAVFNYEEV